MIGSIPKSNRGVLFSFKEVAIKKVQWKIPFKVLPVTSVFLARLSLLLLHRDHHIATGLVAHNSRDVAPACRVVRKHDAAGTEALLGPVADLNLHLAR